MKPFLGPGLDDGLLFPQVLGGLFVLWEPLNASGVSKFTSQNGSPAVHCCVRMCLRKVYSMAPLDASVDGIARSINILQQARPTKPSSSSEAVINPKRQTTCNGATLHIHKDQ